MSTDDMDYLAGMINSLARYLNDLNPGHEYYETLLSNLAALYFRWYEIHDDEDALASSIAIQRRLIRQSSVEADPETYVSNRINLGRTLPQPFSREQNPSFIEYALV